MLEKELNATAGADPSREPAPNRGFNASHLPRQDACPTHVKKQLTKAQPLRRVEHE